MQKPIFLVVVVSAILWIVSPTAVTAQLLAVSRDIPLVTSGALTEDAAAALTVDSIQKLPLHEQCRVQRLRAEKEAEHSLNAFGCIWRRIKLRTPKQAEAYFGTFAVGNTIGFSLGNEQTALYTELLSDNIYITTRLGYARVGFATQVSTSEDSTGSTTVNQFFQGGGNALLYVALPLRVRITYADDRQNPTPVRRFDSALTLSFGADVPELSAPATESAGYGRVGVQTAFTWRTADEDFRFFVLGNGGYTYGFSNDYYQNLAGKSSAENPVWGIVSGTATVGVDLAQAIRIGVRFGTSSFGPAQHKPQLAVQVLSR
jgi:hypothetical protein